MNLDTESNLGPDTIYTELSRVLPSSPYNILGQVGVEAYHGSVWTVFDGTAALAAGGGNIRMSSGDGDPGNDTSSPNEFEPTSLDEVDGNRVSTIFEGIDASVEDDDMRMSGPTGDPASCDPMTPDPDPEPDPRNPDGV